MSSFIEWFGVHNANSMLYELLKEDLTKEQFRAIWTTYCVMLDLIPDTKKYTDMLIEIYECYWCFSDNYDEYELFMGELLY